MIPCSFPPVINLLFKNNLDFDVLLGVSHIANRHALQNKNSMNTNIPKNYSCFSQGENNAPE